MRPTRPMVTTEAGPLDVRVDQVAWVRADGHYVELHTTIGRRRVRSSFAGICAMLEERGPFYLSARGYLVNLSYVSKVEGCDFIMRNGTRVPISTRRVTQARKAWSDHLFKHVRGRG